MDTDRLEKLETKMDSVLMTLRFLAVFAFGSFVLGVMAFYAMTASILGWS